MTEELQTQQPPQPSTMQPQTKPRLGPQDYRNSELVTKLMAANPPYLYSPAVGPHNFFFSEMLRSLVANKRNESLRNATEQLHHQQQQQQQQQMAQHPSHLTNQLALQAASTRRPRKRSWSQHRYYPEALKEGKDIEDRRPTQPEKPLELTNKLSAFSRNIPSSGCTSSSAQKYADVVDLPEGFKPPALHERKMDEPKVPTANGESGKSPINNPTIIQEPPTGSMPPSDLILPPPPPVWYPPLYPPYGIDPLHFFIDLRVSGHIYDRKKDSNSPGSDESVLSVKREHSKLIGTSGDRQGSAFSVPKPRDSTVGHKTTPTGAAMNLAAPPEDAEGASVDGNEMRESGEQQSVGVGSLFLGDVGDHKSMDAIKNTNYVLQNLPRIYEDLNGNHKIADRCLTDDEANGNMSDEQEQDSKSVGSVDDLTGDENKYKDIDLNVISDEESIAVDEN
ncbi:uncharacterized protein LOC128731004 [Anopheles nili]|uniref:uncharacterized protein LOC128731004 n=1 Tax=Anopheles nili TaxID=185578 RepID=UPI00237B0F70|nr:uncharacterized protein LOC128731004 [Anopheles nili]